MGWRSSLVGDTVKLREHLKALPTKSKVETHFDDRVNSSGCGKNGKDYVYLIQSEEREERKKGEKKITTDV
jgi:hypothetical protein